MRRRDFIAAAALISPFVAACASQAAPTADSSSPGSKPAGEPTVKIANDANLGEYREYLTDPKGMSLYYYNQENLDNPDWTCYDPCAQIFPPYVVPAGTALVAPEGVTAKLSFFTRKDGALQVLYNGIALHYYAKDSQPGDTKGNEFNLSWFLVKPGDTIEKVGVIHR